MTDVRKIICITCPKGCNLDVEIKDNGEVITTGNGCKRGQDYVLGELHDPRRMVATTVKISGSVHPLLPVYTSSAFPKGRIHELLDTLRKVELQSPVEMGQGVVENVLGEGIDILSSRNMVRVDDEEAVA